jgi:1,4-alpha-glucan branching enzyme
VPGVGKGSCYKYRIHSHHAGYRVDKADPFAIRQETPPKTASVTWDSEYEWGDREWMETRAARNASNAPISVYEVHLGSFRREGGNAPGYREMAEPLAAWVKETGFTHVEFLPVMEHPFYGSWGYQVTGLFAPTSRYGTPQDFMALVDHLHREGIGVILDWVPSHFPRDEHGPGFFDGTHLYEHADPQKGVHPDWGGFIYNYGRSEVRSFLLSAANHWLTRFHADALRTDAVASMLYLDYSRKAGEWIPNEYGGRENLEAITFLRRLNEDVYRLHPDTQTIAEESTAWPGVSRPTWAGGLGFGMKWDMGWMHDTLQYFARDPIHRKWHHHELTFRAVYAFTENFMLPLSHDEVVHGKGSLIGKMPGDDWQKRANLRLLFAWMWGQPGKKLLFMGGEFAQEREWSHERELDWSLLDSPAHRGVRDFVRDLNRVYRETPALNARDHDPEGFAWVEGNDAERSVYAFLRRGEAAHQVVLCIYNATPVVRRNYRLGVPYRGEWREILNGDAEVYGGSGQGNLGAVVAKPVPLQGQPFSLTLTLPPLAAVFLEPA